MYLEEGQIQRAKNESHYLIFKLNIQIQNSWRFPPIVEASSTPRISITFHITERP